MLKLNGKNVTLLVLVAFITALLVGCGGVANSYEMEIHDNLEKATGLDFDIYEMEIIAGKECEQSNSFFNPDTGMEVYVWKYSDTYAETYINFGNASNEQISQVMEVLNDMFDQGYTLDQLPNPDLGGY